MLLLYLYSNSVYNLFVSFKLREFTYLDYISHHTDKQVLQKNHLIESDSS